MSFRQYYTILLGLFKHREWWDDEDSRCLDRGLAGRLCLLSLLLACAHELKRKHWEWDGDGDGFSGNVTALGLMWLASWPDITFRNESHTVQNQGVFEKTWTVDNGQWTVDDCIIDHHRLIAVKSTIFLARPTKIWTVMQSSTVHCPLSRFFEYPESRYLFKLWFLLYACKYVGVPIRTDCVTHFIDVVWEKPSYESHY
jgi:hypothetical protein